MILLAMAALLPLTAADETNLKVVVTNQAGKGVDNASVIIKFVQGRSKAKFGAKIRKEWDLQNQSGEGMVKSPIDSAGENSDSDHRQELPDLR